MKIISYNIHTGTDKDKNRTLRQMAKYLKIQNCDIICLQEVLYSQYRMLKFYLQMDGSFAENVSDKQYGICIFSKYKILVRNHVFLTSKKEQRGFAHIKVKIEGDRYLNVINTHLGLDKYERVKQINEILDFISINLEGNIEDLAGNIVCGDFNEKNIFISIFNDSAVYTNNQSIATFEKSNARIDYILVDKSLGIYKYKLDKINLSDHYPIIVDIKLN